jgi:hypothetical protein
MWLVLSGVRIRVGRAGVVGAGDGVPAPIVRKPAVRTANPPGALGRRRSRKEFNGDAAEFNGDAAEFNGDAAI